MAAGLGYFDPRGVWRYGEADATGPLFSDFLNVGQASVSSAITADRVRLTAIEAKAPFAQAAGVALTSGVAGAINAPLAWGGIESASFPAGRFSVAPIVTLQVLPVSGAIMAGAVLESVTASGFTYRVLRVSASSGPATGTPVHWRAVQMKPLTAAG